MFDKTFDKIDFAETPFLLGNYENCVFLNCNFSNCDLSRSKFIECTFNACNLSMAKLDNTAFQTVVFKDSKLMGLHFDSCNPFQFAIDFDGCILNLSIFYKMNLKKCSFKNTTLHEVDFSEADLTSIIFQHCDLDSVIFDRTNLEKTDFRTAFNYKLDPDNNRIKKAKFSTQGVLGLLQKYDIEVSF